MMLRAHARARNNANNVLVLNGYMLGFVIIHLAYRESDEDHPLQ